MRGSEKRDRLMYAIIFSAEKCLVVYKIIDLNTPEEVSIGNRGFFFFWIYSHLVLFQPIKNSCISMIFFFSPSTWLCMMWSNVSRLDHHLFYFLFVILWCVNEKNEYLLKLIHSFTKWWLLVFVFISFMRNRLTERLLAN